MKNFDASIQYLGPEGHWLSKYIPKFPPSCSVVYPYWNFAAFRHDCDYAGDDYAGWFGWLKKLLNRKVVEKARNKADAEFRIALIEGVKACSDQLTEGQLMIAYGYAEVVYESVNKFGWAFYKVGGK